MLRIEYERAKPPMFRLFGEDAPARISVVMVSERRGERASIWVIGPRGVQMTEYPPGEFRLVERRPATEQDTRELKLRTEELLASSSIPIASIKYGIVPEGFNQLKPPSGLAPPLERGEKYEVFVMAAGDFGSLEFVA